MFLFLKYRIAIYFMIALFLGSTISWIFYAQATMQELTGPASRQRVAISTDRTGTTRIKTVESHHGVKFAYTDDTTGQKKEVYIGSRYDQVKDAHPAADTIETIIFIVGFLGLIIYQWPITRVLKKGKKNVPELTQKKARIRILNLTRFAFILCWIIALALFINQTSWEWYYCRGIWWVQVMGILVSAFCCGLVSSSVVLAWFDLHLLKFIPKVYPEADLFSAKRDGKSLSLKTKIAMMTFVTCIIPLCFLFYLNITSNLSFKKLLKECISQDHGDRVEADYNSGAAMDLVYINYGYKEGPFIKFYTDDNFTAQTTSYPAGARLYVEVEDQDAADTKSVSVTLSPDQENDMVTVELDEGAPGIFRGSVETATADVDPADINPGADSNPGDVGPSDSVLQVAVGDRVWADYDSGTASYAIHIFAPAGRGTIARFFTDETYRKKQFEFIAGSPLFIQVEDQAATGHEQVQAMVSVVPKGDAALVTLREAAPGVFRGLVPTESGSSDLSDSILQIPTIGVIFELIPSLISLWFSAVLVGFFIIIGLIMSHSLRKGITRPQEMLVQRMSKVREGNYDLHTTVYTNDEIGQLKASFNEMLDGLIHREFIKDTFGKFMSIEISRQIIEEGKINLGGEEVEATVLFSDIRNFTSMSENMTPAEVVAFLNNFFSYTVAPILEQNGVVNKYIGDCIMALFGVPAKSDDHADRALEAALGMREALASYNITRRANDLPPVKIGIGMHTGKLVAGNIGAPERIEYTVIGDTVNVASRIESQTKNLDAVILISQSVYDRLSQDLRDGVVFKKCPGITVKGKREPMDLYKVLGSFPSSA